MSPPFAPAFAPISRVDVPKHRLVGARALAAACALFAAAAVTAAPVTAAPVEASAAAPWVHAYAAYGTPKYPRGFDHFDYVNPNAPKGGTLKLANPDRRNSFDKFNPYTIKGSSPAGATTLMFETLAVRSGDEPMTMYGLLAEDIAVAPDKSSISFRLNPKARFNNGDPVRPEDVKYSFDMLTSKAAAPGVRTNLAGVKSATVLDDRTIRFDLAEKTNDTIFNVGGMPVFSRKWGRGPRRQAEGVRRDHHRISDRQRTLHDRTGRFRTAHRFHPQPRLLGTRPRRDARAIQLRARDLSLLPGQRDQHGGVQGR